MKKILLIEDNNDVRENTSEILELENYEVTTAENGKIGVDKALNNIPDLIICDIMMPVLDGYGVFKSLSNNPKTASIPFIFLTAKSEKADMRKGMNLGADDYLTKPFEEDELLEAIECRIKKNDFLKKEFSKNTEGFIEMMSHNLIDLQEHLVDMAFASVRQKTAKALLELDAKGMIADETHKGISIPREDFAGLIGTATETAIRMLTEFKNEGLITVETNRRLVLLDKESLKDIAEFG